jgi:hypothetical protein
MKGKEKTAQTGQKKFKRLMNRFIEAFSVYWPWY